MKKELIRPVYTVKKDGQIKKEWWLQTSWWDCCRCLLVKHTRINDPDEKKRLDKLS